MRTSSLIAATLAGILLLPGAAAAAPPPVRDAILFFAVDRNGDGVVERSEADAFRAIVFDAIDTNKDGRVTPQEVGVLLVPISDKASKKEQEKLAKKREQILALLGLAKPEGMARDEFVDLDGAIFVKADANRDGKIGRQEFAVVIKAYGPLLPR
jgi:hypothetical protein